MPMFSQPYPYPPGVEEYLMAMQPQPTGGPSDSIPPTEKIAWRMQNLPSNESIIGPGFDHPTNYQVPVPQFGPQGGQGGSDTTDRLLDFWNRMAPPPPPPAPMSITERLGYTPGGPRGQGGYADPSQINAGPYDFSIFEEYPWLTYLMGPAGFMARGAMAEQQLAEQRAQDSSGGQVQWYGPRTFDTSGGAVEWDSPRRVGLLPQDSSGGQVVWDTQRGGAPFSGPPPINQPATDPRYFGGQQAHPAAPVVPVSVSQAAPLGYPLGQGANAVVGNPGQAIQQAITAIAYPPLGQGANAVVGNPGQAIQAAQAHAAFGVNPPRPPHAGGNAYAGRFSR